MWPLEYRICSLPEVFCEFGFHFVILQYLLEYFPVIILTFVGGGQIRSFSFVVFKSLRFAQGLRMVSIPDNNVP